MDIGSVLGLILGTGFIILGASMEGLHMRQLMEPTAFMIVAGGTLGACVLQFPLRRVFGSIKGVMSLFFRKKSACRNVNHSCFCELDQFFFYGHILRRATRNLIKIKDDIVAIPGVGES